jgi:hypothetical protein
MKNVKIKILVALINLAIVLDCQSQGTAFTYQGKLNNGVNPANGSYDFAFTIFGTNNGGSPITQTITNSSVSVSNGLFITTLDFGSFLTGDPAWLEIGVRSNGNGGFTILVPRQQLTPTPYAMFADAASNVVGVINGNQITTGTIGAAQITPGSIGVTQLAPASANGLMTLQVPNSTNLQAVVNSNYLFTNAVANQLTLPANPIVGDRVRATGSAGGFTLAANTSQSVISPPSFSWASLSAGSDYWQSVAMSADGSKMVAGTWNGTNGYIYASTNYGANWFTNNDTGSGLWALAMSADGSRMVAGKSAGSIYVSTNLGVNWSTSNDVGSGGWGSFAVSADGSRMVAGQSYGPNPGGIGNIYTSANYGVNWVQQNSAGQNSWGFATISGDGSKLLAGQRGYYLYPTYFPGFLSISTDYGVSWFTNSEAGSGDWYCGAMSTDGSRMVAVQYPGWIYTSTNFGVNWTRQVSIGSNYWQSIAMSEDGGKIVAANVNASSQVTNGGYIYSSTNYGATWAKQPNMDSRYWTSVAMSADGGKTIAGQYGGNIDWIPNYITQWSTAYVFGNAYATIELVYIGGGLWNPAFYTGSFTIQ